MTTTFSIITPVTNALTQKFFYLIPFCSFHGFFRRHFSKSTSLYWINLLLLSAGYILTSLDIWKLSATVTYMSRLSIVMAPKSEGDVLA